ncbi:hypothetical protein [Variovorax sp. KK3]|uniref:hypothetical protein n=1 Tax=Variovorax sp. KK3 TaxID=1855728 RepID=UPI00117BF5F5|nr:hypothetical protein [Variovorax sp. KK3]
MQAIHHPTRISISQNTLSSIEEKWHNINLSSSSDDSSHERASSLTTASIGALDRYMKERSPTLAENHRPLSKAQLSTVFRISKNLRGKSLSQKLDPIGGHCAHSLGDEVDQLVSSSSTARSGLRENDSACYSDIDPSLAKDIAYLKNLMRESVARHPDDSDTGRQQRRLHLLDCLGKFFKAEYSDTTTGRWMTNMAIVGLRDGIIVTMATLMRDAILFQIALGDASEEGGASPGGVSIAAIALGPALNLLGGLAAAVTGTGNRAQFISRTVLGVASIAAILACYETGTLNDFATFFAGQAALSMARDACNFFFPLRDNLRTMPASGAGAAGGLYAMYLWLGEMASNKLAPQAGLGAIPHEFGNETLTARAGERPQFNMGDSLIDSSLFALAEIMDDFTLPAIVKYMENRSYRRTHAGDLSDEAAHREYLHELNEFADELLNTDPTERRRLLEIQNGSIYLREQLRLTVLEANGDLNKDQRQYLSRLTDALTLEGKAQRLQRMREAPVDDFETASRMTALEMELGVYRCDVELDRLKSISLTPHQWAYKQDLENRIEDFEEDYRRLQSSEVSDSEAAEKELLEKRRGLEVMLGHAPLPPLYTLPPISTLLTGERNLPDLTTLDQQIRQSSPELSPHELDALVRETYVHAVQTTFTPFLATPLEQAALESLDEGPALLPSERLAAMATEVDKKRRDDTQGLKISLGFQPSNAGMLREFAAASLITTPAHLLAWTMALAFRESLKPILEEQDETVRMVLEPLIMGFGMFMAYLPMVLMHQEEEQGQPVRRPGATGGIPPIRPVVEEVSADGTSASSNAVTVTVADASDDTESSSDAGSGSGFGSGSRFEPFVN